MTQRLAVLLENFIQEANSEMPIVPTKAQPPIVAAQEKWSTAQGPLTKKFVFRTRTQRNEFVLAVLQYEDETEHSAALVLQEKSVLVSIYTKRLEAVTELDQEYAKTCDEIYRDVTYSPLPC